MNGERPPAINSGVSSYEDYQQLTLEGMSVSASVIEAQYAELQGQIAAVAKEMPGLEAEKAFLNLPPKIKLALATTMGEDTRKNLLRKMRHTTGCRTVAELFERITHELGGEENNGPSFLGKTQRREPGSRETRQLIRMFLTGVIETREGEEKSLLWALGQRAHQTILAYHAGELATLAHGNGKRPTWRETEEGIEILPASVPVKQRGFLPENKEVTLLFVGNGERQSQPVFSNTGEIYPQVKEHLSTLLHQLDPFPLTPWLFEQALKKREWEGTYLQLESSIKAILPDWPEMEGNDGNLLAKFALASTVASIAREMVDPLEAPGQSAMITELPFGIFPLVIAGMNGEAKEVLLTVGKADAIVIRAIRDEPLPQGTIQWLRNTRLRCHYRNSGWRWVKGQYREIRTREFSFRSTLAELYARIGLESRPEIEIIEHKMQAGDAGPNACLDIETIKNSPDSKHLQTLYEYMFGGLVIDYLIRQGLADSPRTFLEEPLPERGEGFSTWLDARIDYFMERLDITDLQQAIAKQDLGIKGKLVYHFPTGRIVYERELNSRNLGAIWDEYLALTFSRALLRKEALEALKTLTTIMMGEEKPKEILIRKREAPAGWGRVINKEGHCLYLDPEKLFQEMKIVRWTYFAKDKTLNLRCSIDGEEEEIRINLRTFNFRLANHQGRIRLAEHQGMIFNPAQKEATALAWAELWSERKKFIEGKTFIQRVIRTAGGDFIEVERMLHWNPWNNRHEIPFSYLDTGLQSLFTAKGRKQTRCPFPDHEDKDPSTQAYPNYHLYCFGCRRGIHVTDLPKEAARRRIEIRDRRPSITEAAEITPLPPVSAERGAVLKATFTHYQNRFLHSPAWHYLGERRGIDPQRAFHLGLVGYAPGDLEDQIQKGIVTIGREQAIRHGLLRESTQDPEQLFEWLGGMILFPQFWTGEEGVFNSNSGRYSNLLGRALKRKYFLKLPGDLLESEEPHGVFGWDMIDLAIRKGEIVVVEAPIDALTLRLQFGFNEREIPVVSIAGLGHRELIWLAKSLGLRKVIVGVNNDEPGLNAFVRIRGLIKSQVPGIKVTILNSLLKAIDPSLLPRKTVWLPEKAPNPWRPWKDPNELLTDTKPGQRYRYSPPEE